MFTTLLLFLVPPSALCFNGIMRNGGQSNGPFGASAGGYLPAGYTMLEGELVDMSNKMVQRVGASGGGSQYFAWTDQRGPPVFRRREIDVGRRFIVFPDRNYPLGDGHYVVLRRFQHGKAKRRGGQIYEAFYLDLGDSINAMVTNFNSLAPAAPGLLAGAMGGRRVLSAGGLRMKRLVENDNAGEAEVTPDSENGEMAEMVVLRKLSQFEFIQSSNNKFVSSEEAASRTLPSLHNISKKERPLA